MINKLLYSSFFLLLIHFVGVPTTVPAYAQQTNTVTPQAPPEMPELLSIDEKFTFEVKYGFFKLGWVEVSRLADTLYEGRNHHHLFTEIRSNPKIPFMGTEIDQFHSLFFINDEGLPVTSLYWKDNVDENEPEEIIYKFDREAMKVYYKEEDNSRDTLDLVEPATAGHIIFYFSRLFAGSERNFRLPVYVTKKAGFIIAENTLETNPRKYEPFDGAVDTYLLSGTTENIEGPFGFSGDFRAWFLDDDYRVPLEARVKVFLGNVIIRLIDYTREE